MKGKKKIITYALGVIVVLIWGKIIVDFIKIKNPALPDIENNIDVQEIEEVQPEYFEYELSAEYRDPFLGTINRDQKKQSKKKKRPVKKVEQPQKEVILNWPNIQYLGMIQNKSSNHATAILEVEGRETVVPKGESFLGIKLVEIQKDSVVVVKENNYKTILR